MCNTQLLLNDDKTPLHYFNTPMLVVKQDMQKVGGQRKILAIGCNVGRWPLKEKRKKNK